MGESQEKEKIAELCGAIMGDGWIQSNKKSFFLAGDPVEDKEYYDKVISKIIREVLVLVKPKEFSYWGVYGISIHKKDYIEKLLNWGLPKGKKVGRAFVPKWVIHSDNKIKTAFIRGLFDTDGCVFCQKDYTKYADNFNSEYHTKIRLRISSVSQRLIEQVFCLCQTLRFRCVTRKIRRGFKNNRNNHDVYILEINEGESISRWFKSLNPSNIKHVSKYLIWKKFGFCPPNTNLRQRKDILKKIINPYKLYVRECRSGQTRQTQNLLA